MGVYTLVTRGSDGLVLPPEPGEIMVGNVAGAWQARPLDDPTAFPALASLRHAVEELFSRVGELETLVADLVGQKAASVKR